MSSALRRGMVPGERELVDAQDEDIEVPGGATSCSPSLHLPSWSPCNLECTATVYLLFIDESGNDRRESPYEVLTGIAVEDRDIWNLIQAIHTAEIRHFGQRVTHDEAGSWS